MLVPTAGASFIIKTANRKIHVLKINKMDIFFGFQDGTVMRRNVEDGKLLDTSVGEEPVRSLIVWRGAVLSPGKRISQWTSFDAWKPENHWQYPPEIRQGIKQVFLLAKANIFPGDSIPKDILNLIIQFYAA